MSQNRNTALLVAVAGIMVACMKNEAIDSNAAGEANAGEDQEHDYDGEPVEVRLDGTESVDHDGRIVEYIWMSGNGELTDGGPVRVGPDPDNEARPTVELDEGVWSFVLWVKDDDGAVSEPDTVQITVGMAEGAPSCDPSDCPTPPLGVACCTSEDTGAEGDPRGRGPDLCGTDLGSVIASLAGVCLQLDQPGDGREECPEIMGAGGPEVGCCTDEGYCASINESAGLGCHYPQGFDVEQGQACEAP